MDIDFDLSDIDEAMDNFESELNKELDNIGKESIQYAISNGNYQDRTGELRKSNTYEVQKDGLLLENSKEYASYVESKGFEVLTGAALFAQNKVDEL